MSAPALAFAIIAACCWGAWGVADKLALRSLTPMNTIAWNAVLQILASGMVLLIFAYNNMWQSPPNGICWVALGVLATTCATLAYIASLARADVTVVTAVTACYPIVTLLLAWGFLGEHMTRTRLGGLVLVLAGLLLVNTHE